MRSRDLQALEFPRVCAALAEFAASPAGKEACLALRPAADRDAASWAVERTWQCFRLIERHGDPPLGACPDVRPHLRTAAHEGFALDGKALVEVRTALLMIREVGAFFRRLLGAAPALADLPEQLVSFPALETALGRALDDDGGVQDQASDELAAIRQRIRHLRTTLTGRLEELVSRKRMADIVTDEFVTVRNNRFVIPVRAGAAGSVAGVVQDRSISGETCFVEPLFAVDLNNQLLLAVKEEEAIVRRILADLTAMLRAEHAAVADSVAALIAVDALVARARFARAYRCTQPAFSAGEITLRDARHPGLLFTGRPVTPVDVLLGAEQRVLVVTGPNTGGKTVALKTLGLCALMAQSGMLVPAAEGARLPCFSAVFADVGDEQNIERSLSTFSAHIGNLCEILASGAETPLVLLDEPGVGTDPDEGAALAVGIIQCLAAQGARVAVTTHYTPVKVFALGWERCAVAAVDFDVDTLTPRYRLVYHSAGRSLALPIARRLGLPEPVLAAAQAAQSAAAQALAVALEQLETSRRRLDAQQVEVAAQAAALAEREAATRHLVQELRQRRRTAWEEELHAAREFVRSLKAEGREVLDALRQGRRDRAALERFAREQEQAIALRAAAMRDAPRPHVPAGPLRVGDTVEVGDRGIRGELISVDGERAWVQRGTMRFEVRVAELRAVGRGTRAAVQVQVTTRDDDAAREITLIGLRARDAVDQLQVFLDHAVQAGHRTVRIIHGLGSGALRRAVQEYLSKAPYCRSFRSGEPNEGGNGVTMAELDV